MSRIAGVISSVPVGNLKTLLGDMLDASKSGPGWLNNEHVSEHVALGWCGWLLPTVTASHGIIVMLDGQIYNRQEFGRFDNDADLLATLYRKHGMAESLKQLNGDFACAIYDSQTRTCWLARDRFGVKPLYYVAKPERLAFASRPRALLSLPGVSKAVNPRYVAIFAASHYRYFDNDPHASPYAEISQLPAAGILCVKNGHLSQSTYWTLGDLPDFTVLEVELAEQYRELLLDAVSLRVKAARKPAFTLSGGMDSSSVLASAVRCTGAKQHAFSTVYADKTYDESDDIRSMLDTAVERWNTVPIGSPDVFGLLQRMIDVHDEPVATATWLSHYLLCDEVARQGFAGVFGGLGGDELNAGEYEHFIFHFADLRISKRDEELKREVEAWIRYHNHPVYQKGWEVVGDAFARLIDFSRPGRCRPDRRRIERYASVLDPEFFDVTSFEPVMEHPFSRYLKNRTYQDLTRETIPCCLRALDRHATSFGLENFLPFLDHRLVEMMYRIPGGLKIRDGITKHLLRQAMRGLLPNETRTRVKKTGWNAPAHIWFSGSARAPLLDLVHSQEFQQRGIYRVKEVLRLIEEHERIVTEDLNQENHMMFLWQLVNLELWLRRQ